MAMATATATVVNWAEWTNDEAWVRDAIVKRVPSYRGNDRRDDIDDIVAIASLLWVEKGLYGPKLIQAALGQYWREQKNKPSRRKTGDERELENPLAKQYPSEHHLDSFSAKPVDLRIDYPDRMRLRLRELLHWLEQDTLETYAASENISIGRARSLRRELWALWLAAEEPTGMGLSPKKQRKDTYRPLAAKCCQQPVTTTDAQRYRSWLEVHDCHNRGRRDKQLAQVRLEWWLYNRRLLA